MKKYIIFILLFLSTLGFSQEQSQTFYEFKSNLIQDVELSDASIAPIIFSQSTPQKKNPGMAILYSLLLPGMGELYAESYNSGIYFTVADGIFWGALIGMDTYANWQKDRYQSFALANAGVSPDGKDDVYFATIGEFLDIDQYNDQKALERNFEEMYNSNSFFWKWSSTEDRKTYRSMWTSSEQTFNDIRFVVGALIVNRVASAINAVRLVSSYNKRIEETGWNLSVGYNNPPGLPRTLNLNISTTF